MIKEKENTYGIISIVFGILSLFPEIYLKIFTSGKLSLTFYIEHKNTIPIPWNYLLCIILGMVCIYYAYKVENKLHNRYSSIGIILGVIGIILSTEMILTVLFNYYRLPFGGKLITGILLLITIPFILFIKGLPKWLHIGLSIILILELYSIILSLLWVFGIKTSISFLSYSYYLEFNFFWWQCKLLTLCDKPCGICFTYIPDIVIINFFIIGIIFGLIYEKFISQIIRKEK